MKITKIKIFFCLHTLSSYSNFDLQLQVFSKQLTLVTVFYSVNPHQSRFKWYFVYLMLLHNFRMLALVLYNKDI